MEVIFYSGFEKKLNSTKQPSDTGTTKSVRLKENTSLKNPVFLLSENNFAYNYCQYGSTYYFINNIVSITNDLAEYHCSIDILATFKDQIGAAELMVVRAASAYDGTVTDNLYPATNDITVETEEGTSIWDTTDPTFVISTIAADGTNQFGMTSYYMMDNSVLGNFTETLFDYASYDTNTDEISESLFKSLYNPIQYVQTSKCIPVTYGTIGGTAVSSITFGWWDFSIGTWSGTAAAITGSGVEKTVTITLPKHPQYSSRGSYLNAAPYTEYILDFRPFGVFPLDTQKLLEATQIYCVITIDVATGMGILNVYADSEDGILVTTATADCSVDVALAQFSKNQLTAQAQTISGASNTLSNLLTLNIGGLLSSGLETVNSALEADVPEYTERGVNGGLVSFGFTPKVQAKFYNLVDEDMENLGRPYCQKVTLSSLSGFIQTATGNIDTNADEEEKQIISNYLTTGFYYE